jgi:hypothetical protein
MPYVVEVRGAGGCWVQKRERYGALPESEAERAVRLARERGDEARLVEIGNRVRRVLRERQTHLPQDRGGLVGGPVSTG